MTETGVQLDMGDFEVVLVVYRSRPHLEALFAGWPSDMRVAVVDNSSDSDGTRAICLARDNVRYIDGRGVGFGRAANMAAFSSSSPYVVFVNPDSRPSVDDLKALVTGVAADSGSLSHAATMAGRNGRTEMGVGGWEPTVVRALVYALGLHTLFPKAGIFARPPKREQWDVEWTTGACMAVNAERFRRVGGFDEMFYVYAEDMALGRRARRAGWTQVLRPDVRVTHGAGNSGAPSGEMLRLRGASFANYMLAYHRPLTAHTVLAAVGAGFLARGVVAVRHDRRAPGLHAAFVAGLVTRQARVGGVEVADARYEEVTAGLRTRRGWVGWASQGRGV